MEQPAHGLDWMSVGQKIFVASDGDVFVNVYGGVKAISLGAGQT